MGDTPTLLEQYFGIKLKKLKYIDACVRNRIGEGIIVKLRKSLSRTVDIKKALITTAKDLDLTVEQRKVERHTIPSWNYSIKLKRTDVVDLMQEASTVHKYDDYSDESYNIRVKACDLHFPNYSENRNLRVLQTDFLINFDSNLEKLLSAGIF